MNIGSQITFFDVSGNEMDGTIVNKYNGMLCVETPDGDECEIPEENVVYY